jgi:hypothetical protein
MQAAVQARQPNGKEACDGFLQHYWSDKAMKKAGEVTDASGAFASAVVTVAARNQKHTHSPFTAE